MSVIEKKLFNNLSLEEKKRYYRNEFEDKGIFKKIFPNKSEHVEFNIEPHATVLRNEIIRLLISKGIINSAVELENLHDNISDDLKTYEFNSGVNNLTQHFYENDDRFREKYIDLIKFLHKQYFNFPFFFQDTPTIRIHCPKGKNSHHYPRYHTDIGYFHPPQEINLWIPLTQPLGEQKHGFRLMGLQSTRNILNEFDYDFEKFVDRAINDKAFNGYCNKFSPQTSAKLGNCLAFDARCLHTGEPLEKHSRTSIDIRIIPKEEYEKMPYLFQGAGKRKILFKRGESYNLKTSDEL